jgi:hypothetical protein
VDREIESLSLISSMWTDPPPLRRRRAPVTATSKCGLVVALRRDVEALEG